MGFSFTKAVLLDIDGVLTTSAEYNRNKFRFQKKYPEMGKLDVPYPFNDGCVKIFNEILEQTGFPEIILTSDWRRNWTLGELDEIFKFNHVIKSPVVITGIHPVSISSLELNRENEIRHFLRDNDVQQYVIIDDYKLDMIREVKNFVRTRDKEGLKQLGIKEKIIKILSGSE